MMSTQTKSRTALSLAILVIAIFVLEVGAIDIPAVLPDPDMTPPDTTKPVKVYILSGQSNMVGMGRIGPVGTPGTLETITKTDGLFPNLLDASNNWTVRNDVMYRGVVTAIGNGPLTPGVMGSRIGPEMGFGHVMGYYHDEPVIVLKTSQGNRSISWDIAPPSTERFDYNGYTYAGYGDSPNRWPIGGDTSPYGWYAGKQYDDYFLDESDMGPKNWIVATDYPRNCQVRSNGVVYKSKSAHTSSAASEPGVGTQSSTYWNVYSIFNVTDILDNFAAEYPQYAAQGFEIAGFAWWQGHKDQGEPHASRYEFNMVNLIKELRDYYEKRYPNNCRPDAPFVLATVAFDGGWDNNRSGFLTVVNGQLAVSGETGNYPEFEGNVKTVEARGFWRDSSISPSGAGYHYNLNAETFMLVGDALGRAMAQMVSEPANQVPVADAGEDQTVYVRIGEIAEVALNGSDSNDIDGDELTYYWSWTLDDEIYDANGVAPMIKLPVGEYIIQLIVNDGIDDSEPNEVVVTVIDSIGLLGILTNDVIEFVQNEGIENNLLAKIGTAISKLEDDNDKNDKAAVNSLEAFINAVEAQSGKKILEEPADYLIAFAQQIVDLLANDG